MIRPRDDHTDKLVAVLLSDLAPVRPLPSLRSRFFVWLVSSLAWVGLLVMLKGLSPHLRADLSDPWWLTEQAAALATALAAGIAALSAAIPGRPRWERLLPLPAFAIWLGTLFAACVVERRAGVTGTFHQDWVCVAAIMALGLVPAATLLTMVRRGYPTSRVWAAMLALVAAGVPAHVGLRLFYQAQSSAMILVWQAGTVIVLAVVAGLLAHRLLPCPRPDPRFRGGLESG